MTRPDFITNELINHYQDVIQQDLTFPKELFDIPLIMEVCYAGIWFAEELEKFLCPEELIIRLQFHAGKLSFGRDPWEVHQKLLEDYKNDTLEYEAEPSVLN
jgi:hypothetical protein